MAKLAEIKTKQNDDNVNSYIQGLKDEQVRKDSLILIKLMQKLSKEKPKMWGSSIIGFGKRVYKSPATGREVEWFKMGFAPRKAKLSLYLMLDIKSNPEILKNLGKYKTGAGCLYINKLDDIDLRVLQELVSFSMQVKT